MRLVTDPADMECAPRDRGHRYRNRAQSGALARGIDAGIPPATAATTRARTRFPTGESGGRPSASGAQIAGRARRSVRPVTILGGAAFPW